FPYTTLFRSQPGHSRAGRWRLSAAPPRAGSRVSATDRYRTEPTAPSALALAGNRCAGVGNTAIDRPAAGGAGLLNSVLLESRVQGFRQCLIHVVGVRQVAQAAISLACGMVIEEISRQCRRLRHTHAAGADISRSPFEERLAGRIVEEYGKGVFEAEHQCPERVLRPRWLSQQDALGVVPVDIR